MSEIIGNYIKIYPLNEDETTFVARNRENNAFVVVKELTPNVRDIYVTLSKMKPYGVPTIFEVFDYDGKCYSAEELVSGVTLENYMHENKINVFFVRRCASELCRILIPIHKKKIIHRDINPNNVLVMPDGHFMLIDFGIARSIKPSAEHDTTIMGTHGYVAPEQFGFKQTKETADVYSIGALINHMLKFCEYDEVVMLPLIALKCTQLKPEERFRSVSALYTALGRMGTGGFEGFDKVVSAMPFARSENGTRNKVVFFCVLAAMFIICMICYGQLKTPDMFLQMTAGIMIKYVVPFITIGNWERIAEYNVLLCLIKEKKARYVPLALFVVICLYTGSALIQTAFSAV